MARLLKTVGLITKGSLILLWLVLWGCSDTRPFLRDAFEGDPSQRPNHSEVITFYALGDWGTGGRQEQAVARALQRELTTIPPGRVVPPFVLGLGDNVYERGLPEGWNNPQAHRLLKATFGDIFGTVTYHGQPVVFHLVPGNHDYNGKVGGRNGWGDVVHQETTAEKLYDPVWQYYPVDPARNLNSNDSTDYARLKQEDPALLALPEKVALDSGGRLTVVALDTQVLLELYQQNDTTKLSRHWGRLKNLLQAEAQWKIVVGHHPLKSHGKHGGFRTWVWWLPPIFIYTLVDQLFLKRLQDADHPAYRRFAGELIRMLRTYKVDLYLSGHEHNLQFLRLGRKAFQIISGSAAKLSAVTHKDDTLFSHEAAGFVRIDLTDKELWVEFFQVDVKTGDARPTGIFRDRR